jgi:periplasmic protein TonB
MKPKIKSFFAGLSTLQWAIGFSVAVHVLLLTVRFVAPESFNRVFKDTPLEVVLVNAKSNQTDQLEITAQVVAQYKLIGGGDADSGIASSLLPSSFQTDVGLSAEPTQAIVEQLQAKQMRMLADIKDQVSNLQKNDVPMLSAAEKTVREQKRQQLLKVLGAIEMRINEENARPKKRFVSPATRQEAYAIYYDALRRKIEQKGTLHFPEAGGNKLYGELIMLITVNHDGHVLGTEVVTSSNNPLLDARAQAIARQAEPFGDFNAEMRRSADQLVVVSKFKFSRDATLQTTVAKQ